MIRIIIPTAAALWRPNSRTEEEGARTIGSRGEVCSTDPETLWESQSHRMPVLFKSINVSSDTTTEQVNLRFKKLETGVIYCNGVTDKDNGNEEGWGTDRFLWFQKVISVGLIRVKTKQNNEKYPSSQIAFRRSFPESKDSINPNFECISDLP